MTRIFHNYLSKKLLSECDHVGALLAPELASDFYSINLPIAHPPAPNVLAFATRSRYAFSVVEAIKSADLWQGAKPAIVWCRRLRREQMLGTLLHELSHLLPRSETPEPVVLADEDRAEWHSVMAARLSRGYVGDSAQLPGWHEAHGRAFVRRTLHLHARAWQAGIEVGLPALGIAGARYDLSQPWRYMRALGDEPQRMIDEPFDVIDSTPAPAEFTELFAADFEDWCNRRTSIGDLLGTAKDK